MLTHSAQGPGNETSAGWNVKVQLIGRWRGTYVSALEEGSFGFSMQNVRA